jgi:hypothetical protein
MDRVAATSHRTATSHRVAAPSHDRTGACA